MVKGSGGRYPSDRIGEVEGLTGTFEFDGMFRVVDYFNNFTVIVVNCKIKVRIYLYPNRQIIDKQL